MTDPITRLNSALEGRYSRVPQDRAWDGRGQQRPVSGSSPALAKRVQTPGAKATPTAFLNTFLILAQDVAPAATTPWWELLIENGLALTILFIFVTAILSVLVNQRRRDKCLKLMHDYHVSYLTKAGNVIWGDMLVYSKGLEVLFDRPYRTQRGLFKTSQLIYETDLENCLAICRTVDGLTQKEKKDRRRQIRKTFRPNLIRRSRRGVRNVLNTFKDAFSQALTALIGQFMKTTARETTLASQEPGVKEIGKTLVGASGNAYEPMLERHIGKPVVVRLADTAGDHASPMDLPGYLVDYTDRYLAVFNVEHEPIAVERLEVTDSLQRPGYTIVLSDGRIDVTCLGPEALVIKSIKTDQRYAELDVVLTKGRMVTLPSDGGASIALHLERTRRIDIICPRSHASVYFGGEYADVTKHVEIKEREVGMAPEAAVEAESDDPLHDDPQEGEVTVVETI